MKQRWNGVLCRGILVMLMAVLPMAAVAGQSAPPTAHAAAGCPQGRFCVFLPALGPGPGIDLVIAHVEVTQAIQTLHNSVPLIDGKATMLRIFVRADQAATPISHVDVQLTATSGGKMLPGSPAIYPSVIPLANNRVQYDSTVNVLLPAQWVSGAVDLTVQVDPKNVLSETSEANNLFHAQLHFQKVPALQVMLVPVLYTHTPTGATFAAPTQDSVTDWIRRVYPIDTVALTWHAPLRFIGNLTNVDDWSRLLTEISSIRSSEGAPSAQIYYGLIPVRDGDRAWMTGGGIGGAGWIGSRVSAGLDLPIDYGTTAGQVAAHEIGHNLGLPHAPCGTTTVNSTYPYANGSIGEIGVDLIEGKLYLPEISRDLMSYCQPRWISDFNYTSMMQAQLKTNAPQHAISAGAAQNSLLVRAELRADGAQMLPLYTLDAAQSLAVQPADEYRIVLVDGQGQFLSATDVQASQSSLEDAHKSVQTLVPLPEQAAAVRLYHGEELLVESRLRSAAAPSFTVEETAGQITLRWQPAQPVMVRYHAVSEGRWTTLAVDRSDGVFSIDRSDLPGQDGAFEIIESGTLVVDPQP